MKTAIREIPKELPNADIYLDDLFEIEEILSQAFAALTPPVSITFEYEIDESIKVTTHDELIEHGGYSSQFVMKLIRESPYSLDNGRVLWIYKYIHPRLDIPYTLGEQGWALSGRIGLIFKARQSKFRYKNLAESISTSLLAVILWLSLIGFYAVARPHGAKIWYESYLFNGSLVAIGLLVGFGKFKNNRIFFQFVRQDQKAKAAARKELIARVVILLIGTILGSIGTLVVNHFKH